MTILGSTIAGPAPSPQNGASPAQPALILPTPFVRASSEHVEALALDVTKTPTAAQQPIAAQLAIGAFGYLRYIPLLIEATGGTGTAAVYKEDAPWSVISDVSVLDINGGQIFGPVSGYELFLINLCGGYAFDPDPTVSPVFVTPTTAGNFAFLLRIPFELSARDAWGSLPNANSAATFKLNITMSAKGDVYSTDPTALPTVRFRALQEDWAQPEAAMNGVPNEIVPPAQGTTQYWTRQTFDIGATGQRDIALTRLGNYIRNLILIYRSTVPARITSTFPDPIAMKWDGVTMLTEPRGFRQHVARERLGVALPTGVFLYDYTHDFDGHPGGEMRDLYLPTLTSSRIEFSGNFTGAGTLTVLTNDVAVPSGVDIFV